MGIGTLELESSKTRLKNTIVDFILNVGKKEDETYIFDLSKSGIKLNVEVYDGCLDVEDTLYKQSSIECAEVCLMTDYTDLCFLVDDGLSYDYSELSVEELANITDYIEKVTKKSENE